MRLIPQMLNLCRHGTTPFATYPRSRRLHPAQASFSGPLHRPLLHDQHGAGDQASLAQGLAEVHTSLKDLAGEGEGEARDEGNAVVGLQGLRHLEQRRLGRERLLHVDARWELEPQPGLGVVDGPGRRP